MTYKVYYKMQAELNKYFYNDISNIILDYYYKTIFNDNIREIKKVSMKNGTMKLYSDTDFKYKNDDNEDDDDDDNDSGISINDAKPHIIKFWIENFRRAMFNEHRKKLRERAKEARQNIMNEDTDTDSSDDEAGYSRTRCRIFNPKTYNYYLKNYYSPEEFEYNNRYPNDEDSDY